MNTIQNALRDGVANLDQIVRQQKFERAVEHGKAIMAKVDTTVRERRPADGLRLIRSNWYACAAYLARTKQGKLEQRRKGKRCFVPAIPRSNWKGPSGQQELEVRVEILTQMVAALEREANASPALEVQAAVA